MSKIADIIKGIFTSESAIITDDGQRVVSLETILPEVEGLVLFDEKVPETAADVEPLDTPIVTAVDDVVQYATAEQLRELIDRLTRIEQLVTAVDNVDNLPTPDVTEVW